MEAYETACPCSSSRIETGIIYCSIGSYQGRFSEYVKIVLMELSNYTGGIERKKEKTPLLRQRVAQIVDEHKLYLPDIRRDLLIESYCDAFIGYGILHPFILDPSISDITVRGHKRIHLKRRGKWERVAGIAFESNQELLHYIMQRFGVLGSKLNYQHPFADAADQTWKLRLNASISDINLDGPALTIRKHREEKFSVEDLREMGSFDERIEQLIQCYVQSLHNIGWIGPAGSGKTTTFSAFAERIPEEFQTVSFEDTSELNIRRKNHLSHLTRPETGEGGNAITMDMLARNLLRESGDIPLVGEIRDGVALTLLKLFGIGHDGGQFTMHANNCMDAVNRYADLAMEAESRYSLTELRELFSEWIHLFISMRKRKIMAIYEVLGWGYRKKKEIPHPVCTFNVEEETRDTVKGSWQLHRPSQRFYDRCRWHGVVLPNFLEELRT
ncbi:ATPase, T2SS/T4P/T4SS family [Effusibacillus consociatus]|uniref:ATPase, T2SS/T4P/T4SS family n=1 Tax=Effusibacillus consociatus TaxID=1117041 RepID=A0ABV9Q7K7_9BACL